MRPIHYEDMARAVRVLMALPDEQRRLRAARLLHMAEIADRHRLETGRAHQFGIGTLASAAAYMEDAGSRDFSNPDCRACWQIMLAAISAHQASAGRIVEAAE